MPRLFAPERGAAFAHAGGDELIAHGGAQQADAPRRQRPFRPRVGIGGADHEAARQLPLLFGGAGEGVEDAVAVDDLPAFVAGDEAVGVAVVGKARVCLAPPHLRAQPLRVQRPAGAVDVLPRAAADGKDARP